jgi:spore coat polysaccharide biosynthesis protein SpsF (cytidylyltransferase family)
MVIAIVQCRLGSTRFPRKALAPLGGRPVIVHVVERALQIPGVDRVIVATPWGDAGVIAQELPDDERLSVFHARIDDEDVLGRFVAALANYPECETVLRLTGDCPLIDPLVCERVLALYRWTGQYAWTNTHRGDWPDGLDCEVFSRVVLKLMDASAVGAAREHVTSGWRASRATLEGGMAELPPDPAYRDWPKVSIDTPEDLARVEEFILAQR